MMYEHLDVTLFFTTCSCTFPNKLVGNREGFKVESGSKGGSFYVTLFLGVLLHWRAVQVQYEQCGVFLQLCCSKTDMSRSPKKWILIFQWYIIEVVPFWKFINSVFNQLHGGNMKIKPQKEIYFDRRPIFLKNSSIEAGEYQKFMAEIGESVGMESQNPWSRIQRNEDSDQNSG